MTLQQEGDEWPVVIVDGVRYTETWYQIFREAILSGMGLSEARDHADRKAAETERDER